MIVKAQILNDYKIIKEKAEKYFIDQRFEKCLASIEVAANLAYNFNLFYVDEDLEEMIFKIGQKYFKKTDTEITGRKKIIFFDSFGYDNRGLTQQYIRALMSYQLHFCYILGTDKSLHMSKDILEELNLYANAEVYIIPEKLTRLEKISHLSNLISEMSPQKILTHRTPWDSIGHAVFSNVKSAERFHINLTDHAFWLGKNAADYFIEFRNYGANISIAERTIDQSKLLLIPYYPIVTNSPFQGFPEIDKDSTILFTGSSYYKMYGEKGKFFSLIKSVLEKNQKTILLIAGNGNLEPINKFISENNFQNRIFLLGDRKDINRVFQNIDIYIATYPITGGLMAQYAALNKKPIVAFTDPNLLCNVLEEFLLADDYRITHFNEDTFIEEVTHLVEDKVYRKVVSEKIRNSVVTKKSFDENFYSTIFNKNLTTSFERYDIDINRFADVYLEAENKYIHSYDKILFGYFKATGKDLEFKYYPSVTKYIFKEIYKRFINSLHKKLL